MDNQELMEMNDGQNHSEKYEMFSTKCFYFHNRISQGTSHKYFALIGHSAQSFGLIFFFKKKILHFYWYSKKNWYSHVI